MIKHKLKSSVFTIHSIKREKWEGYLKSGFNKANMALITVLIAFSATRSPCERVAISKYKGVSFCLCLVKFQNKWSNESHSNRYTDLWRSELIVYLHWTDVLFLCLQIFCICSEVTEFFNMIETFNIFMDDIGHLFIWNTICLLILRTINV